MDEGVNRMPYVNVAKRSGYTMHFFSADYVESVKQNHPKEETIRINAVCMTEVEVTLAHVVPASKLPETPQFNGWEHSDKVDGLADLINRLTVNGEICRDCVDLYRHRVGGLPGLGRKYYPDHYHADQRGRESIRASNDSLEDAPEGIKRHLWLTDPVQDFDGQIPALCGSVHVYRDEDTLVKVKEVVEDPEDLNDYDVTHFSGLDKWMDQHDNLCAQCEDRAREMLGLPERELTDVQGIGHRRANTLRKAGFRSIQDLRDAEQEDLYRLDGIGRSLAALIKAQVGY